MYDAVYLNFWKVVDSVPHQRLHVKIAAYGINSLDWIQAFLADCKQHVVVSAWLEVLSGILQGSALSPFIFINDLPNMIRSTAHLFVDDTKFYRKSCSENDCVELQVNLQ